MLGRRTPLYVFDKGTMNSKRYKDEILKAFDNCDRYLSYGKVGSVIVLESCVGEPVIDSGPSEVLDESRSFFRVHTGYFSNIPKCIKAEFIASWGCSQSSVVSSSQR
ncbi:hypothetical protein TNCV_2701821 [Trichonephila clavipes]|nr:hypothetical protein TNCV_2701821 [Trichonephila clavipes]